jgi:tripartite-type tricarboxylate transporter receptor subunit TctC
VEFISVGWDEVVFEPTSLIFNVPHFFAGIPDPVRQILEKAFSDGMKTEAFNKLAKTLELFALDPLTGTALLDSVKKSYVLYEGFIKEVGAYKSEKKGK